MKIFLNLDTVEGLTFSKAVRELSSQFNIPKSTCKHILRKFRDARLIDVGSKEEQGKLLSITGLGRLLKRGDKDGRRKC